MQADLSHFIIEDKQNLGWRFHWLRAEQQEPIDICAQKLRYLALYGEKFRLSLGDD